MEEGFKVSEFQGFKVKISIALCVAVILKSLKTLKL
jgi:hypothetical protein